MSDHSASSDGSSASLESLKLRPGTFLQIYHAAQTSAICVVKLLGTVRGKGVMVGLKGDSAEKKGLFTGREYKIRGFSGQHDFSFPARIVQIFDEPIAYAMLSYPDAVQSNVVRKARRSKISLPAKSSPRGKDLSFGVTLTDLNMGGAKLNSAIRIGTPGDLVNLTFAVDFEKNKMDMDLLSTVRYTIKSDSGEGYTIGVEFEDLTQNDKLVLHYITSQESETGFSSDVEL